MPPALALPLGWEGSRSCAARQPPAGADRFENQRQATLGMNGLTKIDGRIEIKVVVRPGGFLPQRLPISCPSVPAR
ncbi:MAG: hypothetical protein ACLRWP_10675 [Bilophila wadsworthia]